MNICAFYNKIDDPYFDQEYEKIVDIWKKSWYDNGWNPIVLNLEDSKKHPKFEEYYKKIDTYPSIHRKIYLDLCYLKWLAIANRGGWFTDIDMININFKPQSFTSESVSCSLNVCPSTIYMTKENYEEKIVDTIFNYDFPDGDVYDKHPIHGDVDKSKYTSDMLILFNKRVIDKFDKNLENQFDCTYDIDYSKYSILHFHGGCLQANIKPRSEIMLQYLKTKKI